MTIIVILEHIPTVDSDPDDLFRIVFSRRDDRTGSLTGIANSISARLNLQHTIAAYEQFQSIYRSGILDRHYYGGTIEEIGGGAVSLDNWHTNSIECLNAIGISLNNELNQPSWYPIREAILARLNGIPVTEPLRLVFCTQDVRFQSFPLELSLFIQQNLTENNRPVSIVISPNIDDKESIFNEQPRILLILGCQKKIESPFSRTEIQGYFPQASFKVLELPSRSEVLTTIRDGEFDGIIFIAHCQVNPDGNDGTISINLTDQIAIQDFFNPFQHSVEIGLKFVFIAGCTSIGLARVLSSKCRVPHVVSFREPVHYQVVRFFLERLQRYWVSGDHSLEVAIAKIKQDSTASQNAMYPGASILPILFSSPRSSPLKFPQAVISTKSKWHSITTLITRYQFKLLAAIGLAVLGFLLITFLPTPDICEVASKTAQISCGEEILLMERDGRSHQEKEDGVAYIQQKDYGQGIASLQLDLERYSNKDPETLIAINNAKLAQMSPAKIRTIAVVIPTTKTPIFVATDILKGIAQAQSECNQSNQKWKLRVVIANDSNNPIEGGKIATELIKHHEVIAVLGHYSSNVTVDVKDIYQQAKTVLLSATSTSDKLTIRDSNSNYFFRVVPSNLVNAIRMVKWAKKYDKVALFYTRNGKFSESIKAGFLVKFSPSRIIKETFDLSQPSNATQEIQRAKAAGAKAIILLPDAFTAPTERDRTLAIIKENNGRLPILGDSIVGDIIDRDDTVKHNPRLVENIVISVPVDVKDSKFIDPDQRDNVLNFWGNKSPLQERTIFSYDAMQVLLSALDRAKDREAVQKVISSSNFSVRGITGKISFTGSDRSEPVSSLVTPNCDADQCTGFKLFKERDSNSPQQ